MKTFLLRELAFLMAPALLLTHFKELVGRALGVVSAIVFSLILLATLVVFVLQPFGWAWLGVAVGAGAALVVGFFFVTLTV